MSKKTALPAEDALTLNRERQRGMSRQPFRLVLARRLPLVRPPSVAVTPPGLMPAQ